MALDRIAIFTTLCFALAGCVSAPEPMPQSDARHVEGRAVERLRLPDTPMPPVVPGGAETPLETPTLPTIVVPPGTQYVCVVDGDGVRKQTAILFAPKVGTLCARHPEMGPCQYERNACRHGGGRVYAADSVEITMQTEAEYDKKVLRVRFRGD